ncbi:MAG: Lrp/AsnC family transcriptional regulator [Pseudomonadota bacterium]
MQIDDVDRRLLRFFQSQPGASAAELAALVGLPRSTCWRRLERLEAAGVIAGVEAIIDWRALGFAVEVALRITLDKTERNAFDTFLAAAREVPEVTEIQTFLGRVDVRLNVLARDMSHYQEIYRSRILNLPHILDIEQLMLISDVKTDEALPV